MKRYLKTSHLFLLISMCVLFSAIRPDAKLEIWFEQYNYYRISKKFGAQLNQLHGFFDGLGDYYYYYFEPTIEAYPTPSSSVGAQFRVYRQETDKQWLYEYRPSFFIRNKFRLMGVEWFTLFKGSFRILEKQKNRGIVRAMLGANLVKNKVATFYIADEVYYNYYNEQEIDFNYLYIGLNGSPHKHVGWGIYYSYYIYKPGRRTGWKSSNVLSFSLDLKFS